MASRRAAKFELRLCLCLLIIASLSLTWAVPATAGTLTATSFAASGANAYTNARNTAYTHAFSTASSATLSRLKLTTPSASDAVGTRYLALSGSASNYAFTADSPGNSVTGDIDIRLKARLQSWSSGSTQSLLSKVDSGTTRAYRLMLTATGYLTFDWSTDGSNSTSAVSPSALGLAPDSTNWVRVTFAVNSGGNHVATYYTSPDGSSWTSVGSTSAGGATSIADTSSILEVGANGPLGATANANGRIYSAEVRNGINGAIVSRFDPSDSTATQAAANSWTSTSPQAETWSVHRSGSQLPGDIAVDLTPTSVSGLPSGGTANFRLIDNAAYYYLATPTAVASSTPCTITLQGLVNTAVAGSYTSTITTYDNSSTPVAIDSAPTNSVAFTDTSQTLAVTAVFVPELTFTVAGRGTVCNGQSSTNFQTGSTGSAVPLGALTSGAISGAAQNLSVVTNAGGGFTVYIRTTGTTPNALRDASLHTIADVPGTAASPGAAPVAGTAGFGYTSSDTSTAFTSNTFAKLTNANDAVMVAAAGTTNKSSCVGYQLGVAATSAAGSYSAAIVYTAVPLY